MEINIPLGRGSWIRNRGDEPAFNLINRFFEENPTNRADQSALIERPALVSFLSVADSPNRRIYTQPGFSNGDLFQISGQSLYKHHMNVNRTITTTQITGVIDLQSTPDMAATDQYLFITDGVALQYTNGTAALASIPGPGGATFTSLDVYNGYVLCVVANDDKFYWLQPGATTFNALDFATAEKYPDKVFQVRVVGDEFWLLGERSIEVWRATGDGTAPFQRIEGRAYNFGIFDGTAVRMKDTSVVCVGGDGTVFNIAGAPEPVSNPAVAEQTRNAIKDAFDNGDA